MDSPEASEIAGSPYYSKDFEPAQLHFKNHDPLASKIRYDVVHEEMQVQTEANNYQVIESSVIIEMDGKWFEKMPYKGEKGSNLLGYFEVMNYRSTDKPLLILKKYSKTLKTGNRSVARGFPSKYADKSNYYLKFKNVRYPVLVEVRKNKFVNSFPAEDQKKVEKFMKKNRLKSRKAEDLLAIAKYYNSLK